MNEAEVSGLLCVGMHEMDGDEESYAAEYPKMNQDTSHGTTKFDVVMATSAMYTDHIKTNSCLDEYHMPGIQALEEIRFGSEQQFELQSEGVVADSEEENTSSSHDTSSATNYDTPGYMEQNLQHIYNTYDAMVDKEGPVMLSPAFIMCGKMSHLEPCLTFSPDGIKIEYSDLYSFEDEKMISLQWELSNLISISCKWVQSVGSAFITLLAGSEAEAGISGPVTVQFCIDDSQWPRKQRKIWDLGTRYQEIWKDIPLDDFVSENWSIEPSLFFPRQYFSSTEDFGDVIYPKGDPDAVSLSKRDVELLLPETFVNDTIIDFYVKYLSTKIESTEKHRYHFFNSFFFRKLADLDKDQGRAPEGRAAFLRVRKWTRKINVFDKDFLFIPINFNLHWSLIVICYPGEVATFEDGETKLSAKVPCILHMDSLKGSHTGLKDIIQSYLWEEWKERHPESALDNSDKFLNLRFVSLELPQQDNSFDCGLFLLHYVELFLTDAPSTFNPLTIDVFSGFLSDDWFAPAEASLKRSVVRKLIHELVTGSFQNPPQLACSSEELDERLKKNSNAERESAGEFLAQKCSAGEPESVCTIRDGTHEIEPSISICLNDSEEKCVPSSGCMLDTGRVSLVDVQNLQESGVCAPDKETVVCDEKNDPPLAESSNQLNMRSCAPEDAELLKGSNCVVTDKEHEEPLFLSLVKNRKVPSQAEVGVQDIMVSACCSVSKISDEIISCQEHSLQRRTEAWDESFRPLQHMDYAMMLDSCKVDIGTNPGRMTDEGDCGDPREDMDLATLGDINKDVAETKCEDSLVDPITAETAVIENAKEIGTSDPITVENTIIENTKDINKDDPHEDMDAATLDDINKDVADTKREDSLVDPITEETTFIENEKEIGTTDPIMVENTIIENSKDISTTANNVNHSEQYVSSELPEENAGNDMTGDSSELNTGNTNNGMTGGSTASSDFNEENIDQAMAGYCTNETNVTAKDDNCTNEADVNADSEGADKYLAVDGAIPCKDDTTCIYAAIPSKDEPCSTKNETVSEYTTSDAKRPQLDDSCEPIDRPCRRNSETMSGNTSSDGKRSVSDGNCEEEDIVAPGDKCIDDAQGTDEKIERHYKRRKVLALEKQRSLE